MADNQPKLIKVSNQREIPIKPEMVLGRQAECDLQLTEGHASRRHAKLFAAEDGVWLEDLNSANGSFVNGTKVTGKVKLASGDRLRFDVEEFDLKIAQRRACGRRRRQDAVSRARFCGGCRREQRCLQAAGRMGGSGRDGRRREQDEVHRSRAAQADGERAGGGSRQHVVDRRSAPACGVRQPHRLEHQAHGRRVGRQGMDHRQPGRPRSAVPGQRRVGAAREDRQ